VTLRAGFIGLGNIGKPLASHLVPTGFETTLYDIAEEPVRELEKAGAKAAQSPRELAENADVIGICVPEDRHVRAVMTGEDGILAGASPGTVVAIHSTVLPATVLELAEQAAPRGVSLLDACVTGGEQRAAEGVVTYLVGGDASVLAKARPFLDASSETVIHAGELGNGAKLKLCINVVTYIQWAAAYEGCKLAMATSPWRPGCPPRCSRRPAAPTVSSRSSSFATSSASSCRVRRAPARPISASFAATCTRRRRTSPGRSSWRGNRDSRFP
jgi:3-hydroxyisobutyrate dehydrogenase